ncbi:VCBS repeat-containing protein [Streptomyces sp. MZ04]|uniref:FG-GAP repeat domain-containing protein n=1 Tax=Streptomyces sp. MZ04 TaxID=2559236 RepID=UPI001FD812DC|nr:VCBS repeat-containing protein [Streptomyces sp. MZ04]
MAERVTIPGTRTLVVCAALALFTAGCGDGSATADKSSSPSREGNPVSTPSAGGPPPSGGKGSKDPDDINGDGHRDLLLPAPSGNKNEDVWTGVVFGSAKGLDPSTHAVYRYAAGTVTTADLDGDGYPDFVSTATEDVPDEVSDDPAATARQEQPTVDWGGPNGPKADAEATRIKVPGGLWGSGLSRPVRGDFDGDGHHDIAALQQNGSVTLLYGPFTRSGAPARSDSRPGRGGLARRGRHRPVGQAARDRPPRP